MSPRSRAASSSVTYKPRPSRQFAKIFVKPEPSTPEPLSAARRRAMSGAARDERRDHESWYVGRLFVPTPEQQQCARRVKQLIRSVEFGLDGAHDGLYVLGQTGVGKSTTLVRAAAEYHRRRLVEVGLATDDHDPRWHAEGFVSDFVPVVFITWRSAGTGKAIIEQLASYLGYGATTASATTNQASSWAERHGIGLVIGDDSRNIADGGKAADEIHNLLKNLNTELGFLHAAWIYAGIPAKSGDGNLYANDQFDQRLESVWLKDFDFDMQVTGEETTANLAWAEYLEDWERALAPVLPDMEPGQLSSVLGRRLWQRTQGSVGGLSNLLKKATEAVLDETEPRTRLTLTKERIATTPMTRRFERTPPS